MDLVVFHIHEWKIVAAVPRRVAKNELGYRDEHTLKVSLSGNGPIKRLINIPPVCPPLPSKTEMINIYLFQSTKFL